RKADQGGVEPPKYARACAGASGDATPYPCRQHGRQTSTDQAAGPSPRGEGGARDARLARAICPGT
ncbi:unnamed protein product, partial [Durusdinium trenchii]